MDNYGFFMLLILIFLFVVCKAIISEAIYQKRKKSVQVGNIYNNKDAMSIGHIYYVTVKEISPDRMTVSFTTSEFIQCTYIMTMREFVKKYVG